MTEYLHGWFDSGLSTAAAVRALLHPDAVLTHRCPGCGAVDHGRPTAWLAGLAHAVSASRSGPHLVVLVRPAGPDRGRPIGVDVEDGTELPPADLVLHPAEDGADLLTTWVAKEAILKMLGTGLARPMEGLRVRDFRVEDLPAPAGHLARVALD